MQSVLLKWKIMFLCLSVLLLCLSTNAVYRESGENVILKCSSAGCVNNIQEFVGMYLYRNKNREEVIYYHPNPDSMDKITPGRRYKDRIETNGSLENHTITISNLTMNDLGVYSCVYKKFPEGEALCNVYTVDVTVQTVTDVAPHHTPDETADMHCENPQCPFLLPVITACAISILVTMIFNLVIFPRVKHWISSKKTTSTPQAPTDYVYEVMTKNRLRPSAAPMESLPSPYNFA